MRRSLGLAVIASTFAVAAAAAGVPPGAMSYGVRAARGYSRTFNDGEARMAAAQAKRDRKAAKRVAELHKLAARSTASQ